MKFFLSNSKYYFNKNNELDIKHSVLLKQYGFIFTDSKEKKDCLICSNKGQDIEISSLEELLQFRSLFAEDCPLIINKNSIEIYDWYRE